MTQMQQLFYDQAPYQVLYYDDELHVYRTDKFGGWQNQPTDGGDPVLRQRPINYTKLTLAGGGDAVAERRGAKRRGQRERGRRASRRQRHRHPRHRPRAADRRPATARRSCWASSC